MNLTFILVDAVLPENIGGAARALKTMGHRDLRLVRPRGHLEPRSEWVAHGSREILKNAPVFPSLPDALSDIGLAVGTTARRRGFRSDYLDPVRLKQLLSERTGRVAIVFGGEESGLSNADLDACDVVSTLPLAADYPSLNLAQAVMIYAWELRPIGTAAPSPAEGASPAAPGSYRAFRRRLARVLNALGVPQGGSLFHRIEERCALLSAGDLKLGLAVANRLVKRFGLDDD